MKKRGLMLIVLMMGVMSFTSHAEMKPKEVSAIYLTAGEWREVAGEMMYQEGLPDGWHNENGTWYYIQNGYPVSGLRVIDGVEYVFQPNGMLLPEGSKEYDTYVSLLEEMHEAKNTRDFDWFHDVSTMTKYERICLLRVYCARYMPGIEDMKQSGFHFTEGSLSLDKEADLALEDQIRSFLNKFSGMDQYSDADKVRYIHDTINRIFDYDYSLTNTSYGIADAIAHDNKIVCGGYAGIFKLVCDQYGLEAEVLTGYGNGEYHAWNRVRVDGHWRYVDCCWDDTSATNDWLLKSKKEFDYTHQMREPSL